jgi:predicted nucleic acid-binding protein
VSSLPDYLLDVSVLVAFGVRRHTLHERVVTWMQAGQFSSLLTCSITELGFVRILAQTPQYVSNVERARAVLAQIRQTPGLPFAFLADDQDVAGLPAWVKTGGQTTDGHLLQLATAHGAVLATLDAKIPGAFVIP